MKNLRDKTKRAKNMPLVKVIRHGQITIPKELREALGIEEGDLLEVELKKSQMIIKPKAVVDKELARRKFFPIVKKMRAGSKNASEQEVDQLIEKAIGETRKVEAKAKARSKAKKK